jgi:CRISPR-associated protein (TIGR02584 family)
MDTKKYREILIFVAGATPQIITETLYGLFK